MRFIKSIKKLTAFMLAISATPLLANEQPHSGISNTTSVTFQRLTLKDDSQKELGLGSAADALTLAYKRNNLSSNTVFTVGLGFVSYDDQAQFYQTVKINNGHTERRSSQVESLLLEADYGIQYYFDAANKNYWNLRAGFTTLPFAKRTIKQSNEICSGCKEDKFTIQGGAYAAFGVGHYFSKVELSLDVRKYAAGDLNNSVVLGLGYYF